MREGIREQYPSKVTISASPLHSKTSWEKGRSPGWTAFDLKQQGKQGLEPELEIDPYPPIPGAITSLPPIKARRLVTQVNNNVDQASTLLNSMVSSGSPEESRIIKLEERSFFDDSLGNNEMEQAGKGLPSENLVDIAALKSVFEDSVCDTKTGEARGTTLVETELSNSFSCVSLVSQNLIAAPIEPEWEGDDDVYLRHCRDVIKAIRVVIFNSKWQWTVPRSLWQ